MRTMLLGFALVAGVLGSSIFYSNYELYLNLHSFGIVFLGTTAVFFISNPPHIISRLAVAIGQIISPRNKKMDISEALKSITKQKELGNFTIDTGYPLIDFSARLWKGGVDKESFEELLQEEHLTLVRDSYSPVLCLKNLSKYPPALGMIGTVLGMIALFKGLDIANKSAMGGNLAVAMTATLYGLSLANFILLPLADRLKTISMEDERLLDYCFLALTKINRDEPINTVSKREFYGKAS